MQLSSCSHENSFSVIFLIKREKDIISSRSYTKYFPAWPRFCYGGILGGKMLWKTNIQNRWHRLEEKWLSSAFFEHIGLDTLVLCVVGALHLLEIQKQQKYFIVFSLLRSKQKNNCLRFLVNRTRNAMRSNNRDDLLHLSFTLKILIFLKAWLYPSCTSMMELSLRKY